MPFFTSSAALFLSMLFFGPIDIIRKRMQSGKFKYKSIYDGLKYVYFNEGIFRLFRA